MKFIEIFNKFESHSYIRRESWDKDMFIQLRSTVSQIRLVKFEIGKTPITFDEYITLNAIDLLADDWIDIEDLMPKEPAKPTTFWDYVDTLDSHSDEWRIAMHLGTNYHKAGKNPDEYLEEIINKVEHYKN